MSDPEMTKFGMYQEPEPKPVAWMYTSNWKGDQRFITRYQSELSTYKADKVWPLYTAPPQKKEWVGLTSEELEFYTEELGQGELGRGVLRAVDDFLRGKNT
jgi:hypothetical protein